MNVTNTIYNIYIYIYIYICKYNKYIPYTIYIYIYMHIYLCIYGICTLVSRCNCKKYFIYDKDILCKAYQQAPQGFLNETW